MAPLFTLLVASVVVGFALWLAFQVLALRDKNAQLERRLAELERAQVDGRRRPPPLPSTVAPPSAEESADTAAAPLSAAAERTARPPSLPPTSPVPRGINWEQFTGAKLLAWAGGLAAFLGAAFFVKYSFEHDLIPPAARIAIGYVFALALIGGGLRAPRPRYATTAQTLCATGIVCHYAVTYAGNTLYRFPWFGPVMTFGLMAATTAAAFRLAVRLRAQVIAVLGLLGGFLTPQLLASGHDNALPLFGYVILLDLGLIALALQLHWRFLVPLGAIGTVATQFAWAARFLTAENVSTAVIASAAVSAVFLGAYVAAQRWSAPGTRDAAHAASGNALVSPVTNRVPSQYWWSAVLLSGVEFGFALRFLRYPTMTLEPSLLFAFTLVTALGLLTLTWFSANEARPEARSWLPLFALFGVAAVEFAWHVRHFSPVRATSDLGWYLVFHAVFAAFPFLLASRFSGLTGPWATAALSGIFQFVPVYWLADRVWRHDFMGIIPALFAAVPLVSLWSLPRLPTTNPDARFNQLAWFSGTALFFVSLIVPVQFERQWITLGWAVEGAALLWLLRRLPHPGLRFAGIVLLLAAFVRLSLNPAVLAYHPRTDTPIFNWYLYSYGLVIACLFAGARLLAPGTAARWLAAFGIILAFLLVNIEIADFFSPPGTRVLTFQFSGNLPRDMTYTIAWALFALTLLLISMWKHARGGRAAALALFAITVSKLFLHDLAHLRALHRIAALFAVAIIAIGASVAYQRFLSADQNPARPAP